MKTNNFKQRWWMAYIPAVKIFWVGGVGYLLAQVGHAPAQRLSAVLDDHAVLLHLLPRQQAPPMYAGLHQKFATDYFLGGGLWSGHKASHQQRPPAEKRLVEGCGHCRV